MVLTIMDEIFLPVAFLLFSLYLIFLAYADETVFRLLTWIVILAGMILYAVYRTIYLHIRIKKAGRTWKKAVRGFNSRNLRNFSFLLLLLPFDVPR